MTLLVVQLQHGGQQPFCHYLISCRDWQNVKAKAGSFQIPCYFRCSYLYRTCHCEYKVKLSGDMTAPRDVGSR